MKGFFIALTFLLSVGSPIGRAQELLDLLTKQPILLQAHIKWEKAPRKVDPKLSAGSAVTICFCAGSDFWMLSGTVYKKEGKISASAGDSESIWKGKWTLSGGSVRAQFRVIYHDVRIEGEIIPGPVQEVTFEFEPKGRVLKASGSTGLRLDGMSFEISPLLVPGSVEEQWRFGDSVGKDAT